MIVDVLKYLIFGTKEELGHFFEKAQEGGFMEFIAVTSKKPADPPVTVQSLLTAIKILKRQPPREPYLGGGDLPFAMQISERVIELKEDLEKLYEESRVLSAEIARIAPFGDFSLEDIEYIENNGQRTVQFFCMKTAKSHKTNFSDEIIYVNTEYDLDYFITINTESRSYPGMIEMHIDAPVGELESRLNYVGDATHRFEGEIKEYAGHIDFLLTVFAEELNKYHLTCAKKDVSYPLQNNFFVIEAWVPKNRTDQLFSLLDKMAVHAEPIVIGKDEKVPTCLENHRFDLIGEDLVKIYDTPAISDEDPSRWILWFFALFFAIIVGDGGYGILFLALAFYLKWKFPRVRGQERRMLKLLFILATSCILWGVFTSSYFGLKIAPGSLLSEISPLHYMAEKKASYHIARQDDVYCQWVGRMDHLAQAQTGKEFLTQATVQKKNALSYQMLEEFSSNILMEITILVAIVHLSASFLRYLRRNIAGLGWIAFMVGGYLYFPSVLNATSLINFMGWISKSLSAALGLQLLLGGIAFAVLAALIQRRWKGWSEIANVVQVFADVLSYLRLYALGLAGSIMATTFNQEGSALGLVLGFVVILAGHGVNILLSFMGGVIHGLRLNFLEWYHYCFDGGGRLFKPLSKIKRSS
jgi:V/A-type H+-transporting ATPase subunit I